MIERDNFKRDAYFINNLANTLRGFNYELEWHNPSGNRIQSLLDPFGKLLGLPAWLRKLTKVLLFMAKPHLWKYYFKWSKRERTIEERCTDLKRHVAKFGKNANVIIFSRSAGGRVASLIADEVGIKKVICIGYPFKHPDKPDEPERYKHLAIVKTPFLIIQGSNDRYGGDEVLNRYELSDAICIEFVDTDHDFRITAQQWDTVHNHIKAFIEGSYTPAYLTTQLTA